SCRASRLPYTTLFRSSAGLRLLVLRGEVLVLGHQRRHGLELGPERGELPGLLERRRDRQRAALEGRGPHHGQVRDEQALRQLRRDRESTRLNSSQVSI